MRPLLDRWRSLDILALLTLLLLVFRLMLNYSVPLMDKTEARYAEIARIMVETDNWVVPQIDYGTPFWAKPPLSTWMSALSFKWFGVNEFSARLPYFILALLIILIVGKYAKRKGLSFWFPAFVLLTLPEFFLHAGVVSTDTALAFSIVLVMLSFWETVKENGHWVWKYLFFIGIGSGLLAKGPIVLMLAMPPLIMWTWAHDYFKRVRLLFPWFKGFVLVAAMVYPWYYLMEEQSPGFIDYFILGEHFKRFLDSSWSGDKYGFPKSQPLGMVWVFLVLFAVPWIFIPFSRLIKNWRFWKNGAWQAFLWFWLLWTPVFFTVSKSLIHPYILPVMVPLALLVVHYWKGFKYKKPMLGMAMVAPIVAIMVFGYSQTTKKLDYYANSDKKFITNTVKQGMPIYHFAKKSYSGQFYSGGKIGKLPLNVIESMEGPQRSFILIIKKRDTFKIPKTIRKNFKIIGKNHKKLVYQYLAEGNDKNVGFNKIPSD